MKTPYGRCPKCLGLGVKRERRLNGDDECVNGHVYQSCDAIHDYIPPARGDRTEESEPWSISPVGMLAGVVNDLERRDGVGYVLPFGDDEDAVDEAVRNARSCVAAISPRQRHGTHRRDAIPTPTEGAAHD